MLKFHLIVDDPGGSRASIIMACGKRGRIRDRHISTTASFVEGDTWRDGSLAPTGFAATDEIHFKPDRRTHCARCIKYWVNL